VKQLRDEKGIRSPESEYNIQDIISSPLELDFRWSSIRKKEPIQEWQLELHRLRWMGLVAASRWASVLMLCLSVPPLQVLLHTHSWCLVNKWGLDFRWKEHGNVQTLLGKIQEAGCPQLPRKQSHRATLHPSHLVGASTAWVKTKSPLTWVQQRPEWKQSP